MKKLFYILIAILLLLTAFSGCVQEQDDALQLQYESTYAEVSQNLESVASDLNELNEIMDSS